LLGAEEGGVSDRLSPDLQIARSPEGESDQTGRSVLPSSVKGALGLIAVLAVCGLPFARLPGPPVPGVTAAFSASLFVIELATAMLLLVRFRVERRPWLVPLVCAYFFSTFMAILYLLAFPGALQPAQTLIGDGQAASWLFVAWTLATPSAAISAALLEIFSPHLVLDRRTASRIIAVSVALTIGCVALLAAIAVRGAALPALVSEGRWTALFMTLHIASTATMLLGVVVIAWGPGKRSDLFAWFGVSLMAMAVANVFAAVGGERYSLGWTAARIGYAVGAGVLFGFFLWLFARQQKLLANARERLEADVAARTTELRHMVGERDMLLSEVYHRVNNNLQVLRSMLHLERRNLASGHEAAALARMDRRTLSIGVVHRRAMQTRLADDVDVRSVIEELGLKLQDLMSLESRGIRIEVRSATARMKLDLAVPLGLLIQELVASVAEQIGPHDTDRTILIDFKESCGVRQLTVANSGITHPDEPASSENLIISSLIAQLGGGEDFSTGVSAARVVSF
jgi:two-component sensor histidine kinase